MVLTSQALNPRTVPFRTQVSESPCLAPGLTEALNPSEDERHGGSDVVPGGAAGASDPDGDRRSARSSAPAGGVAAGR